MKNTIFTQQLKITLDQQSKVTKVLRDKIFITWTPKNIDISIISSGHQCHQSNYKRMNIYKLQLFLQFKDLCHLRALWNPPTSCIFLGLSEVLGRLSPPCGESTAGTPRIFPSRTADLKGQRESNGSRSKSSFKPFHLDFITPLLHPLPALLHKSENLPL